MSVEQGEKQFDFTVIMAVYNVEPFLKEAILSVLSQDIGFEENVQLVLVDDGSSDGSGRICDTFSSLYPENIQVIHQENAGVSAARNAGLPYIRGRYVNFLDADDKLSPNTFSMIRDFFQTHEEEVDLVSVPMEFFDAKTEGHPLNRKFSKGTRLVDLAKEPDAVQLSLPSSFVRAEALTGLSFDTELAYAEDAKVTVTVLLQRCMLGLVAEARYYYRRRSEGRASAIQQSVSNPVWYLPYMERFAKHLFDASCRLYGKVLPFVQHDIMYDIQWRMVPMEKMGKVLTEKEITEYKDAFFALLEDISDEVILAQKNIWQEQKTFLWRKKHGKEPELRLNPAGDDFDLYLGGDVPYFSLSRAKSVYEFLDLDKERDALTLEGYTTFIGLPEGENVKIYLRVNGQEDIPCELVRRRDASTEVLGEVILPAYPFRGTICGVSGYEACGLELSLVTEVRGVKLLRRHNVRAGSFFPLGREFPAAYAEKNGWLIRFGEEDRLVLTKALPGTAEAREALLLNEMAKNGKPGETAVNRRRLARILKPFMAREIWLVSDRINKADDNGEALFSFLQNHKEIDAYFVLSKDSIDYERISRIGQVVEYLSEEHLLLHLMADRIISSAGDAFVTNPFGSDRKYYRDILAKKHQVFLQHGITKDDISAWINRYEKNLSMVATAALPEYRSILEGAYFYDERVVKLTGFPRHDRLADNRKKQVAIVPTWRKSLDCYASADGIQYSVDGLKHYHESLKESDYFRYYNRLINHPKLLDAAEKYGYQLVFMPHPNLQPYENWFDHPPAVKFCGVDTKYREIISESCLAVTDYSSVVFDFAYLGKPVLYSQFDKDEIYTNHLYGKGYFDYERDGFGEVEYDLEHTVARIIEYMEDGCVLKDKYRERIEKFFGYHDRENCRRTFEAILGLGVPDSFAASTKKLASSSVAMSALSILRSASEGLDGNALSLWRPLPDLKAPEPRRYLRYIFPFHLFKEGEKIAIYGAGEVGTEFFRQAKLYGYVHPVLIVDRNASSLQPVSNLPIRPIDALLDADYDSVLIAIRFERIAGPVKQDLVKMGIPKEKIKWDGEVYFADDWGKRFWRRKAAEREEVSKSRGNLKMGGHGEEGVS